MPIDAVRARAAAVLIAAVALPAAAGEVVYDTFGPSDAFDTGTGYVVAGDAVPYAPGEGQTHGARFRSTVSGRLERIDAALQLISGANAVSMELWSSDADGNVGSMIASWALGDAMAPSGDPGAFVSFEPGAGGPTLAADERYWLIPRAAGDTDASWMFGAGGSGPLVWERPDGALVYSRSELPAARVIVAVPAPAGAPALAGVLAFAARRRRRALTTR